MTDILCARPFHFPVKTDKLASFYKFAKAAPSDHNLKSVDKKDLYSLTPVKTAPANHSTKLIDKRDVSSHTPVSRLGYQDAVDRCDSMDFDETQPHDENDAAFHIRFVQNDFQKYRYCNSEVKGAKVVNRAIFEQSPVPECAALSNKTIPNKQRPWSACQVRQVTPKQLNKTGLFDFSQIQAENAEKKDPRVLYDMARSPKFQSNLGNAVVSTRPTSAPLHRSIRPTQVPPNASYIQYLIPRNRPDQDSVIPCNKQHGGLITPLPLSTHCDLMEVAEIIQDMRQQASFRCLHVADFLRPFDRFKRGAVCAADFRRGLDQCGCFALSEAQHAQLRSAFMIDTDRIAVNSPTARVAYAAFCELLQPKCAAPTALTHDLQRLKQLVAGAERRAACAASSGLSVERSRRTARLLRDLAGRVKAGRLAVRDCLVVFDGRAEGRIDKEQLEQGLASCLGEPRLSADDLGLIYRHYQRGAGFDYSAFCRDVDVGYRDWL